ncbi:MAG: alpha/beta hydrolase fold domain-containing protein, partial [Bacteroidota bacterium]
MSSPEPALLDRLRGTAARVLRRLPQAVQVRLSGQPPIEIDGQRLDPAVQMVLALNPREDHVPLVHHDVQALRDSYRRDTASISGTPTRVGSVENLTVQGAVGPLAARLYRPEGEDRPPLVVFFHGGGFVEGDLETHDEPCRVLCREARHAVLSVAYR